VKVDGKQNRVWRQKMNGLRGCSARRPLRMKEFDYSQSGCYFITICVKQGHEILSEVVGDGVLDVPFVKLTDYGEITEKNIIALNAHYNHISIAKYVIMPNHIHMFLLI
jgi:REP element-mobilizing transposase RayT